MVVGGRELIDTLWNVNFCGGKIINCLMLELIDTLWNVNTYMLLFVLLLTHRINRYIMECKSKSGCVLDAWL